jgi:CelD/BcsL family acetyltransferase involved in cellulose biosynthesis
LLPRLVDETAAARRRANYLVLLEELGHLVPPPFDRLSDEAAPFAFPVAADDKPALLAALKRRRVEGLDFWSTPHPLLPVGEHPKAAKRRATLVALPVHQELRRDDLDRIAEAVRGPRGRRGALQLVRLSALEDLRAEWTALAEATRNVFATWEWATTWWEAVRERRPLHLLAARAADGRVVALLPLYEWRTRPLRVVRQLGHDAGDQLGPICDPRDRTRAAAALRLAFVELGADVLLAEHLPGDEGWSALLGGRVLRRESSPVLPLAAGAGDDVGSGKLRKGLRYEQRRLEREHSVGYRLAADASRLDGDLDILFALHRARWPSGASAFGPQETFQRAFAHVALARGWLRLWFLELDGRPAAAWYGFRYRGVESHYQSGRDPSWERSSVGLLLLAHTIDQARVDGMDEYRFLRGGEAYKHRFARADPGLETVGLGRGALGNVSLAGAAGAGLIRSRTAAWAGRRRTSAPATSSRR